MARPRRGDLKPRLAERRRELGLTQQEVADRLETTPEVIRKHERGLAHPTEHFRSRYVRLYGASEVELGLRGGAANLGDDQDPAHEAAAEDAVDILARVQRYGATTVGTDLIAGIDMFLADVVERYEGLPPDALSTSLIKQRRWIDGLIDQCRHPRPQAELFRLAAQTSGLLGYLSVNRGEFQLARAYCTEAFQLGDFAQNPELQAWALGTQSFCEYYAGNYEASRELAVRGQDIAGNGSQAVRLMVNGEARALGKLGDVQGVHRVVARAYEVLEEQEAVPGVSSCVSFGGYSVARTASNAVTAYVALGLPDRVQAHADIALPEFEASDSRWSQALIRLDLANSLVVTANPEPERAAELVGEALHLSATKRITSVTQRSTEFLGRAARWSDTDAIRKVRDAIGTTGEGI